MTKPMPFALHQSLRLRDSAGQLSTEEMEMAEAQKHAFKSTPTPKHLHEPRPIEGLHQVSTPRRPEEIFEVWEGRLGRLLVPQPMRYLELGLLGLAGFTHRSPLPRLPAVLSPSTWPARSATRLSWRAGRWSSLLRPRRRTSSACSRRAS